MNINTASMPGIIKCVENANQNMNVNVEAFVINGRDLNGYIFAGQHLYQGMAINMHEVEL